MTMEITTTDALKLMDQHLQIWSMEDGPERQALMETAYAEDICIFDPGVELNGYEAINTFINNLHQQFPGFAFTNEKLPEAHHNTGIVFWLYGPKENPGQIPGNDVFIFNQGKIAIVYVYVIGTTTNS